MFNWKFWEREGPGPADNPRVAFEMLEDGDVFVTVDWPDSDFVEDKASVANAVAALVAMLRGEASLPLVQHAVSVAGDLKGDPAMAVCVLHAINRVVPNAGDKPGPAVAPDQAFNPKGE